MKYCIQFSICSERLLGTYRGPKVDYKYAAKAYHFTFYLPHFAVQHSTFNTNRGAKTQS